MVGHHRAEFVVGALRMDNGCVVRSDCGSVYVSPGLGAELSTGAGVVQVLSAVRTWWRWMRTS